MIIQMGNAERQSLAEMEAMLESSQGVRFAAEGRKQIYAWVEQVLVHRNTRLRHKDLSRRALRLAGLPKWHGSYTSYHSYGRASHILGAESSSTFRSHP